MECCCSKEKGYVKIIVCSLHRRIVMMLQIFFLDFLERNYIHKSSWWGGCAKYHTHLPPVQGFILVGSMAMPSFSCKKRSIHDFCLIGNVIHKVVDQIFLSYTHNYMVTYLWSNRCWPYGSCWPLVGLNVSSSSSSQITEDSIWAY